MTEPTASEIALATELIWACDTIDRLRHDADGNESLTKLNARGRMRLAYARAKAEIVLPPAARSVSEEQ